MQRDRLTLWWCYTIVLAAFAAAMSAVPCHAEDIGVRDTCRLTSGTWVLSYSGESTFSVELWGWSDEPELLGVSIPLKVSFDTTGFDPSEWNIHPREVCWQINPDWPIECITFWLSTVDSFIVVDTFIYDPAIETDYELYVRSVLDTMMYTHKETTSWGYNGLLLWLMDFPGPVLQPGRPTKIGDLHLRITDPGRLPDSFSIEIDSMFFPDMGAFKYSPPGGGHVPEMVKSVITVMKIESACGDVDASGGVDLDDVVYLVNFIFAGGPPPGPMESGDVDCSGAVCIDDAVYLIYYIFSGGSEPCDTNGDGVPDC